jgi:ABC-2 type transport system permease protein
MRVIGMRKYWQVAKLTLEEYLVYRLNFVLWRFRSLVFFLSLWFFWLAIYGNRGEFLGYEKVQMLTYVVGVAFLRSLVLGTRTADVTGQIRSGELSKLLVKPVSMFKVWMSRDAMDKVLNLGFTIVEIGVVLWIFKFPFYMPTRWISGVGFLVATAVATGLFFFLSLSLSALGFWTEEMWATRWLFGIVFLEFLAGVWFPIDVLPQVLQRIIYLTPFPYLVFLPMKVWLEQLSFGEVVRALVICGLWAGLFYWLARRLWEKGIKNYGAYGG